MFLKWFALSAGIGVGVTFIICAVFKRLYQKEGTPFDERSEEYLQGVCGFTSFSMYLILLYSVDVLGAESIFDLGGVAAGVGAIIVPYFATSFFYRKNQHVRSSRDV